MRRWTWKATAGLVVATFALLSCSGTSGPSQPAPSTPSAPPFASGTYQLTFIGRDSSPGQDSSAGTCFGNGFVWFGMVITEVEMTVDGDTWRGRPKNPGDGSFELILAPTGRPAVLLFEVAGTIHGEAVNGPDPLGGGGRVRFGSPPDDSVSLTGFMLPSGLTNGTLSGDVVFSGGPAGSPTCRTNKVQWVLSNRASSLFP